MFSGAAVIARLCPACGKQFAPGTSPAGSCPACLLKRAFVTDEDPDEFLDDARTTLPDGATVGPFLITGLLGRGGMSAVYRAEDLRLARTVALKVLPQEFLHDRTFARRFEHEARIIAGLAHDHIVPIYASGIDDSIPWMSMRLIAGGNVGTLLEQRRPEPAEAIRILRGVADALDYAHARGVVHRDIKPTNILLDGDGVYIGDFGLAQMLEQDPRATRTGTIVGTPHYIAPERALGQRADHRCDIYSLGIVAYEMFVGKLPFAADSPVGVLLKHVNEPLPAPPAGLVPPALAAALQKAAAKDIAKRWPSAGAFVSALESALTASHTGIEGLREERRHMLVTPARLRRTGALIGGLAAAIGMSAIGMTWWIAHESAPRATPSAAIAQKETSLLSPKPSMPDAPASQPPVVKGKPPAARPSAPASLRPPDEEPRTAAPAIAATPPEPAPFSDAPSSPAPPIAPVTTLEVPLERGPAAVPPRSAPRDVVTPPKRSRTVVADYPAAAKAAELEGDVLLRAEVGTDGKVRSVTVVRPIHRLLADAARRAVLRYEYEPRRRNGVPEPATVEVTVSFKLY